MKRIFCLILALSLCLVTLLTSCTGNSGPVVMEYEGVRLTEDIYRYWVACYKAQFAYQLNEENEEEIAALIDENIKKSLVSAGLFNRYGLQLSDTAREQINRGISLLVEDIGNGDRAAFNEAIAEYGIDYDGLKIAFTYEQMALALRGYLFGENGHYSISREQYENYYKETYAHVYMIYVCTVDFATDEDNLRIWDEESGSYLYEKKTGTALAEALAKADEVRTALKTLRSEAEFQALAEDLTEDPSSKKYTDGYYFSKEGDYSDYVSAVTDKVHSLKVGETAEVESEIGYHFIYRAEPTAEAWDAGVNEDFFEGFDARVRHRYFEMAVTTELPLVAVYSTVKDEIDFSAIPANWELYW